MSVFTNPSDGAAEDAAAYITAVIELLGEQDPMEVLGSTESWCRARAGALTDAELGTPEAPGKWSVAEVLQHLADSELVWGYRLRKVLAEDRPTLAGYDQDRWADRLGYADTDPVRALDVFATLRAANLALLRAASEADLDRVGVHAERGDESVRHIIRLYAGHDLVHRNQIERIVKAVA